MTKVLNTNSHELDVSESADNNHVEVTPEKDNHVPEDRSLEEVEISKALQKRLEPLNELVYSEQCYVERLKLVQESYIPAVPAEGPGVYMGPKESQDAAAPFAGPPVPTDLAARWRILWGNWGYLYEWHSKFLERLRACIANDPDRIPALFNTAEMRLRTIYTKYCENHRKARVIAEQFRDYFDELRVHIGDRHDVDSHLMQPVQRIMRYQLPLEVIVRYTERAKLPSYDAWQEALRIMKQIPKDTQLVLEATMITGLDTSVSALGKMLIRGNLMVTVLTKPQLIDLISSIMKGHKSGRKFMPAQAQLTSPSSTVPMATMVETQVQGLKEDDPLSTFMGLSAGPASSFSGVKFQPYRVFFFMNKLLITEEEKAKRRPNPSNVEAFAQQAYHCAHSVTFNNMKFASIWWQCAQAIPEFKKTFGTLEHIFKANQAHDRRFVLWEHSANSNRYFILDPIWEETRSAWLKCLEEVDQRQNQFVKELLNPHQQRNEQVGVSPDPLDPEITKWAQEVSKQNQPKQDRPTKFLSSGNPFMATSTATYVNNNRHKSEPQPDHHNFLVLSDADGAGTEASGGGKELSTIKEKERSQQQRIKIPGFGFSFRQPKKLLSLNSGGDKKDTSSSSLSKQTASGGERFSTPNASSLTRTQSMERQASPFRKSKISTASTASPDGSNSSSSRRKSSSHLHHANSTTVFSNTVEDEEPVSPRPGTNKTRGKKYSMFSTFLDKLKPSSTTNSWPVSSTGNKSTPLTPSSSKPNVFDTGGTINKSPTLPEPPSLSKVDTLNGQTMA